MAPLLPSAVRERYHGCEVACRLKLARPDPSRPSATVRACFRRGALALSRLARDAPQFPQASTVVTPHCVIFFDQDCVAVQRHGSGPIGVVQDKLPTQPSR
jgi:hypothetical protein